METILSATLLSLLTGLTLYFYAQTTRIGRRIDQQATLIADAQVALTHLKQAIREAPLASFSRSEHSFAVVSPKSSLGDVEYGVDGTRALWGAYRLFFWADTERTLYRKVVDIPTTSPARLTAQPLEAADLGDGAEPLGFYSREGRVLTRNVENFSFQEDLENRLFEFRLTVSTPQHARGKPHRVEYSFAERCRN